MFIPKPIVNRVIYGFLAHSCHWVYKQNTRSDCTTFFPDLCEKSQIPQTTAQISQTSIPVKLR